MKGILSLICIFVLFGVTFCQEVNLGCGECNEESCTPPSECLAGMTKDKCDCCFVCGRSEFQRCDHPDLGFGHWVYGPCGDDLTCVLRTDLDLGDDPEAWCVCNKTEAMCGSDGMTYANECQLNEARYRRRDGLVAMSRGPCKSEPKIKFAPVDLDVVEGKNFELSCETYGFPVPLMEWRFQRGDITHPLPVDDSRYVVQTRGGPSDYRQTSWLQVMAAQKEDDGTYWCAAKNEIGQVMAPSKVTVIRNKDAVEDNEV